METLQSFQSRLSEFGVVATTIGRLYAYNRELYCSPLMLEIYTPRQCYLYMNVFLHEQGGDNFNLCYMPGLDVIRITPRDQNFQFIANQIEAARTSEHLESCERMMINKYGEYGQPDLQRMIIERAVAFAKSFS